MVTAQAHISQQIIVSISVVASFMSNTKIALNLLIVHQPIQRFSSLSVSDQAGPGN